MAFTTEDILGEFVEAAGLARHPEWAAEYANVVRTKSKVKQTRSYFNRWYAHRMKDPLYREFRRWYAKLWRARQSMDPAYVERQKAYWRSRRPPKPKRAKASMTPAEYQRQYRAKLRASGKWDAYLEKQRERDRKRVGNPVYKAAQRDRYRKRRDRLKAPNPVSEAKAEFRSGEGKFAPPDP